MSKRPHQEADSPQMASTAAQLEVRDTRTLAERLAAAEGLVADDSALRGQATKRGRGKETRRGRGRGRGRAGGGASGAQTTTAATDGTGAVPSLSRGTSHASAASAEASVAEMPVPESFKTLGRLHQALNTVYTFCCARKHLATTFDTIKSSVENLTRQTLTHADVARVKSLLPDSITFEYIDEDSLAVHVLESGEKWSTKMHDDLFKDKATQQELNIVLLFEFTDGELKRKINREKEGGFGRRLRPELKLPTFTPAAMTKLIDKRNAKFNRAVNTFLHKCEQEGIDPVMQLDSMYTQHLPVKPEPVKPVEIVMRQVQLADGDSRPLICDLLEDLMLDPSYQGQVVQDGHRTLPEHEPQYGTLKRALSQQLVDALYTTKNITQFYSHQAEAINNLWDGRHVIVSTSTSSGKSLIYQAPVLHALQKKRETRAMYIFPTKALAQDQKRSLVELISYMDDLSGVMVETFDGDTPMNERQRIRDNASIIFTNPDMLHLTILPQEDSWRTFLKNLKYVVVDELHVYNGLFGSHVAFIMRRLRRICATVGNRRLQFISCSATMANPEAHMKTIFGVQDVALTDQDGSPNGRKEFVCWNPPYVDPFDPSSGRISSVREASKVLIFLMMRNVRTIAFCKVRKACEVFVKQVRQDLQAMDRQDLMDRVMSYRGGYTAQDRRKIEHEMFKGNLLGIIATNALELGVDIGSLDAVLMIGFPYSISALRQQSGRAGRRNKDSLAMYIADPFPMDQHYMANPNEIFTMPNTELQVDLTNTLVLEGHLQCAAAEMPLNLKEDEAYFGKTLAETARERLVVDDNGFYHCHPRFLPKPSRVVGIRDTEDGHYAIIDVTGGRNVVLEELEPSRANFTVYEGAIFMHQGHTYLVRELNPEKLYAKVVLAANIEWTTRQRDFTDTDPIETEITRVIPKSPSKAFYGAIRITRTVYGFFKIDKHNNIIDAVDVDNPAIIIHTKGMWIDIPKSALELLSRKFINCAASIHAAEHALLSLLPNFVMSSEGEVRTECKVAEKEHLPKESNRKRPARLTLYDAKGGASGSGLSLKAFEFIHILLQQAIARITQCKCSKGCPSCTTSSLCSGQVMDKIGAGVILRMLAGEEIDEATIPEGEEPDAERAGWTVSVASEVRSADQRRVEPVREPSAAETLVKDEDEAEVLET